MGIYPDTRWENLSTHGSGPCAVTKTVTQPGLTHITVYVPVAVIEHRDDCFCCSCSSGNGGDPYCRNHGWVGRRPCEHHGMPGQADEDGYMAESVETKRASH